MVKAIRKLAFRGNALYIQVPKAMADALRWKPGDPMIIEASSSSTARVRRVEVVDLRDAAIGPMTLHAPEPAAK